MLVVGDANPDLLLRGDVVPRFRQHEQLLTDATLVLAGSAGITAHGLARLGRPVTLLAAIGDDAYGSFVREQLQAAGVGVDLLHYAADLPTGLSVILSRSDDRAILTLPGAIPTLTTDDVARALASTAPGHLHVASLFLQPQLVDEWPALLAQARAAGWTTSLDTNADPADRYRGVDAVLEHVDLFLPNATEASAIAGVAEPRAAAAALAAAGPLVVMTDGGNGALAAAPDGSVLAVAAVPCHVVDSTGAGDTFAAVFLDAWLDGRDIDTALRRSVFAASRVVAGLGGTAGQPTAADIDAAAPGPARRAVHA